MDNNKAGSKTKTTTSVTKLIVGVLLIGSLFLTLSSTINQVATAQRPLLPVLHNPFLQHQIPRQQLLQSSSILGNINNINNRLAALTQIPSTTVFPFIANTPLNTASTPFLSGQAPFVQGISTNGFVSFLCASNGIRTPNPSVLSFQVSSSTSGVNSILTTTNTATSIPLVGSFALSSSSGAPSVVGQINTGQISGNTFTLQGTLTSNVNTLSGGLSSFCTTSPTLLPTFNGFTIAGTCGTNAPVAFAIDRIVVGAFTSNVACNNIA
jgi:hypothetical protein